MKKSAKHSNKRPAKKFRPSAPITPAQFIRQHILRMTITELAWHLGRAVQVVARYDTFPEAHRETIVRLAKDRGKFLFAGWFERVPLDDTVREG